MNNQTDTQDTSPSLSDKDINEIRDAMLPSQGDSFNTIAFARAIEAKCRTLRAGQGNDDLYGKVIGIVNQYALDGHISESGVAGDACQAIREALGRAGQSPTDSDVQALREAATRLSANVEGPMRAFEADLREIMGNTNWAAIMTCVSQVEAALRSTLPQTTGGKGS